jgi:hypothetical protein
MKQWRPFMVFVRNIPSWVLQKQSAHIDVTFTGGQVNRVLAIAIWKAYSLML